MADSHLVYTDGAYHKSFRKLKDPLKKWVFHNLVSNPSTSRTGIYRMGSGALKDLIDCQDTDMNGKPILEKNGELRLIGDCKAKQILMDLAINEKIIMYEPVSHIVYILDFLEMVPFGLSADIISGAILKDYQKFRHEPFWEHFFQHWGQYTLDYLTTSENKSRIKAERLLEVKKIKKIEERKIVTENMKNLRAFINTYISKNPNP